MTSRVTALTRAALVAVGVGALTLTAPLSASAHSEMVSSTPPAGGTLTELPAEFSVTMNETLLGGAGTAAFALIVQDAAGGYYGDGCLSIVDATLSTPAALGGAGDYTMSYQVISADGHPVAGEIPFTWAPTSDAAPAPASTTAPTCGGNEVAPGATGDGPDAGSAEEGEGIGSKIWIPISIIGGALAVLGFIIFAARHSGSSPRQTDSSSGSTGGPVVYGDSHSPHHGSESSSFSGGDGGGGGGDGGGGGV